MWDVKHYDCVEEKTLKVGTRVKVPIGYALDTLEACDPVFLHFTPEKMTFVELSREEWMRRVVEEQREVYLPASSVRAEKLHFLY